MCLFCLGHFLRALYLSSRLQSFSRAGPSYTRTYARSGSHISSRAIDTFGHSCCLAVADII
jgi:hypothetical protein